MTEDQLLFDLMPLLRVTILERVRRMDRPQVPGVMIEQGMLGKNEAARSITPGNEDDIYRVRTSLGPSGLSRTAGMG